MSGNFQGYTLGSRAAVTPALDQPTDKEIPDEQKNWHGNHEGEHFVETCFAENHHDRRTDEERWQRRNDQQTVEPRRHNFNIRKFAVRAILLFHRARRCELRIFIQGVRVQAQRRPPVILARRFLFMVIHGHGAVAHGRKKDQADHGQNNAPAQSHTL